MGVSCHYTQYVQGAVSRSTSLRAHTTKGSERDTHTEKEREREREKEDRYKREREREREIDYGDAHRSSRVQQHADVVASLVNAGSSGRESGIANQRLR